MAVESFQNAAGFELVELSYDGKVVSRALGHGDQSYGATDPIEIAEEVIDRHFGALGVISADDWRYRSITKLRSEREVVRFDQYVDGVRLYGHDMVIGVSAPKESARGRFAYLVNSGAVLHETITYANQRTLDSTAVASIIANMLKERGVEGYSVYGVESIILGPSALNMAGYSHAYEVAVGDTMIVSLSHVDAQSGKVFSTFRYGSGGLSGSTLPSLVPEQNHERRSSARTEAVSTPFWREAISSPVSTTSWGTIFALDGGDTSTTLGLLQRICQCTSPLRLWGDNFQLLEDVASTSILASSGSNFYFSGADSISRDAVHMYYHLNKFIDDYNLTVPSGKLTVRYNKTNGAVQYNQGTWAQSSIIIDGFESDEWQYSMHLATEIIIHEYVHALTYSRNSNLANNFEFYPGSRSIWEGVSDFLGIVYHQDQGGTFTQIGGWVIGTADADIFGTRDIDNSLTYASDYGSNNDGNTLSGANEYDASLIVSGGLWEFIENTSLDTEDVVSIVIDAMAELASPFHIYDLKDAIQGISECDSGCDADIASVHNNRWTDELAPYQGDGRTVASEEAAVPSRPILLDIKVWPNPAVHSLSIRMDEVVDDRSIEIEIVDVLGRIVASSSMSTGRGTIDISDFASGVYYVSIWHPLTKSIVSRPFIKQ